MIKKLCYIAFHFANCGLKRSMTEPENNSFIPTAHNMLLIIILSFYGTLLNKCGAFIKGSIKGFDRIVFNRCPRVCSIFDIRLRVKNIKNNWVLMGEAPVKIIKQYKPRRGGRMFCFRDKTINFRKNRYPWYAVSPFLSPLRGWFRYGLFQGPYPWQFPFSPSGLS